MTKRHRVTALLLAAALGLAALGQFYFAHRREYLWDGLVFYGLAALFFVLARRQGRPKKLPAARPRPFQLAAWLRERPIPAALMAIGLFFSLVATLLSRDRLLNQSAGDVVALWVLGIGAVGLAALWLVS